MARIVDEYGRPKFDLEEFNIALRKLADKMEETWMTHQKWCIVQQIGEPIAYNEFLSTTKGETYNPEGQVQIFIQDAKNGRDISSINEGEQEVLYKNGASFVVLNIVENDGIQYILLGEIEWAKN